MITVERLNNGLSLIIEEMPHVESAAYDLFVPGGIVSDDERCIGASLMLAELTSRGADGYDSRGLSDAFDRLGVRHGEGAGMENFSYRGSLLADKLEPALELVSLMVREPVLPEDQIGGIKSLLLQDIDALMDNPAQRALMELRRVYYPAPYGRPSTGTREGLEACALPRLREMWQRCYQPGGSVLSVAGNVRSAEVLRIVDKLFGSWCGQAPERPAFGKMPGHTAHHIEFNSAQLQIALSYPSATFGSPHYYTAKVAAGVLSGGMFGRLFTEVREKRGLCYSVYARHGATRDYGTMTVYAGTVPERAQETLDVSLEVLRGLQGSVREEELKRAQANLMASLIISEETSSARASSNASDWWLEKRVRSLEEIRREIEAVTTAAVDDYLKEFPANSFMLLTLGARRLEVTV